MLGIAAHAALSHSAPVDFRAKLLTPDSLLAWRECLRSDGKKLAVTNGCFDLLHVGHVNYLAAARAEADVLLVLLNSDRSVRELKGDGRPINSQDHRAVVVAALQAVDAVCIFDETRATRLLAIAAPDVYVKGGDYSIDQLPQEERDVISQCGGRVVVLGHVPGQSTSALIEKLAGNR